MAYPVRSVSKPLAHAQDTEKMGAKNTLIREKVEIEIPKVLLAAFNLTLEQKAPAVLLAYNK